MKRLDEFLSYEFEECLLKAKVIDSFQYFQSSYYKLNSASISLTALKNIYDEKIKNIEEGRKNTLRELAENGKTSIKSQEDEISFLGVSVDRDFIYNKLYNDIYSNLHNFFDVLAQFINSAYLAEEALPSERLHMKKICKNFGEYTEYAGDFQDLILSLEDKDEYKYIEDINNTTKHRFQIFVNSSYNILNGDYKLTIPGFQKDRNIHTEKELLKQTEECLDFCIELLNKAGSCISNFLNSNIHFRVKSRLYNPKTYLYFKNSEDLDNCKLSQSMYCIELDESLLLPSYSILLKRDCKENGLIETINCPYETIIVQNLDGVTIGILYPVEEDINTDKSNIEPIEFRKYNLIKDNYHKQLHEHLSDLSKKVYPLVSELELINLNEMN